MPLRYKNKIAYPSHPWQGARIQYEVELIKKYGLRRKREIWRMNYILKQLKSQAKSLISSSDESAELQKKKLFDRVRRLNLLKGNISLDEILSLKVEDLLERRLQTLVYRQGLARTMKQARQMIVHGHIMVGDKVISSPSYLVKAHEESRIRFRETSPFAKPDHPERVPIENKSNNQNNAEENSVQVQERSKNKSRK
ncbi:MAG: 30S ribosomal protein S4 [Candidatus Woesearchaeota archaeon]